MSQDLPPLDDFEDQIKNIQYTKPKQYGSEDYAKPDVRFLEGQEQEKEINEVTKKMETLNTEIEAKKKTQTKKQTSGFGGFKKGFFSSGGSSQKKQQKIPELKANKKANPLQFKEVQDAMKMNNYLDETRSEWMNDNFLQKVTKNGKVGKLFSNPEYMKAIDMFKTNPKEAMAKYGQDKQFMDAFQQFSMLMGMQFQGLAKKK